MRSAWNSHSVKCAAAVAVAACLVGSALRGDEPRQGGLGRLFRLGQPARPANSKPASAAKPAQPQPPSSYQPIAPPPANLPSDVGAGANRPASPRITPQPRVSRAVTESDPLITRVSIGRSDDGKQFCMFLQIHADGTVLDTEGVHRVGADVMRPLARVLQNGDYARFKGHCGGPPTDFIEQVRIIVYDRSMGRLRASAFSFSGNPKGCDPAVKTLNDAIEAIQTKISSVGTTTVAQPPAASAAETESAPPLDSKPIPLTPIE